MTRPVDFAPAFAAGDFISEPSDLIDERIEAGGYEDRRRQPFKL